MDNKLNKNKQIFLLLSIVIIVGLLAGCLIFVKNKNHQANIQTLAEFKKFTINNLVNSTSLAINENLQIDQLNFTATPTFNSYSQIINITNQTINFAHKKKKGAEIISGFNFYINDQNLTINIYINPKFNEHSFLDQTNQQYINALLYANEYLINNKDNTTTNYRTALVEGYKIWKNLKEKNQFLIFKKI